MEGRYVFRADVRIDADAADVAVGPGDATTVTVFRDAPDPGTEGWLFFRNVLWHGEVADHDYARELVAEWLGEPVESVSFRELQVDEAYLEALSDAIGADLEAFNADSVTEARSKYLGSSIRVTDRDD